MAEPRKVFRIEQSVAARLDQSEETAQADLRHAEIMRELNALRSALATAAPHQLPAIVPPDPCSDVARLTGKLNLIADGIKGGNENELHRPDGRPACVPISRPQSRLEQELNAVASGAEQATQRILAAAEAIGSASGTLSAALDGKIEQGLAQDIRDGVIQIYEACNFHDLIGQRIGKILAALKFVEDHIARVLDEIKTASAASGNADGHALHGPRLDGDDGHASQHDVDAMFANERI